MGSLKYLNVMLTLVVALLGLNLYVQWHQGPAGERIELAEPAYAQGTINAAEQRRRTNDLLQQSNERLGRIEELLRSGNLQVRIRLPQSGEGAGE